MRVFLDLSDHGITDGGVQSLIDSRRFGALVALNVNSYQVREQGLLAIAQSHSMPNLRVVSTHDSQTECTLGYARLVGKGIRVDTGMALPIDPLR